MKLLSRLLALFIVVPLVELVLLIRIGQWLGTVPTVLLVVLTGMVGAALARREGLRTLTLIRRDVSSGRFPVGRLLDGAMILTAGALLLTPGVLTDVLGLALLVPGTRGLMKGLLTARVANMVRSGQTRLTLYHDEAPGGEPPPPGRAL